MRRIVAEPRRLRNVGRLSEITALTPSTPFVSTASRRDSISLLGEGSLAFEAFRVRDARASSSKSASASARATASNASSDPEPRCASASVARAVARSDALERFRNTLAKESLRKRRERFSPFGDVSGDVRRFPSRVPPSASSG